MISKDNIKYNNFNIELNFYEGYVVLFLKKKNILLEKGIIYLENIDSIKENKNKIKNWIYENSKKHLNETK